MINLPQGATAQLHVWGRPLPGMQLRSFSLNLIAAAAGIDFVDGTFEIHNDIDALTKRFQFVHDSSVPDPLDSSDGFVFPDGLFGLLGTTLHPVHDSSPLATHDSIGIGPNCHPHDSKCFMTNDGPAWLIASLDLQRAVAAPLSQASGSGISGGGTIGLYMQIASQGMRHYAPLAGDYNQNGFVELGDYEVWRTMYCDGNGCPGGLLADGNGNGTTDAADYTVWRNNLGAKGAGLEPSSLTDVTFGTDVGFVYNAGPGMFDMGACIQTNRDCTFSEDSPDAVIFLTGRLGTGSTIPEPGSAWLSLVAVGLVLLWHVVRPRIIIQG